MLYSVILYQNCVYWLSVLSLKGIHRLIDGIVQWNLKKCLQILSIMVPEDCLLIVHSVLYLKKVNWLNIVNKCALHPKRNFGAFQVFQVFYVHFNLTSCGFNLTWLAPLHAKIIYLISCWKKSQNNCEAILFPSIRYLYESPKKTQNVPQTFNFLF